MYMWVIRTIYVSLTPQSPVYILVASTYRVLIQIGTEALRNKRKLTYFPNCLFILLEGAIFVINLCTFQ